MRGTRTPFSSILTSGMPEPRASGSINATRYAATSTYAKDIETSTKYDATVCAADAAAAAL